MHELSPDAHLPLDALVGRPSAGAVDAWPVRPLPRAAHASLLSAIDLIVADAVAFLLCATAAVVIRDLLRGGPTLFPAGLFVAGGVWVLMRLFAQLYPGYGLAPPEELRATILTTLIAAVGHGAALFIVKEEAASRVATLVTWAALLLVSWFARGFVKGRLIHLGLYGAPVIIAGTGPAAALAVQEMRRNPGFGYVPVAFFDSTPASRGTCIEGVPVLGSLEVALAYPFPYPVRHAVIAMPELAREDYLQAASSLLSRYAKLAVVPDLLGVAHLWVRPRAVGTCLALEVQNNLLDPLSILLKRATDLLAGLPLLAAAAPVIALSALAVKIASPGPAFFCQEREGLGGRRIRIWKIRTMVPDAEARLWEHLERDPTLREEWQSRMKLRDDPRIVPVVGRFLRRFSLDELPQLWSVVKGEMSLVGPRAFVEYHLAQFTNEFRALRRRVPSGITGLWQVTVRSDGDLRAQEEADSYYIRNWSLWLDLWIMLQTLRVVLRGEGGY